MKLQNQTPSFHQFLAALGLLVSVAGATAAAPLVPPGVEAHRDLAYVTNGHARQKLDLYLPADASQSHPLIAWIHGGAWMAGSKDSCPLLKPEYLSSGYAVASIEYRLSGDAVFPAQIEDCKAAIRWLRAHASEYHLDAKRIGVWGSSAGGHLVALLGASGNVKEFDVGENLDQSSRVQAVSDFFGPTDLVKFATTSGYEIHASATSPESRLIGGMVLENRAKAARANPIPYLTKAAPPYLIVHGDQDPTVTINQSQLLFDALKPLGVPVHFHTIHGAGHGGPGFAGRNLDDMVKSFFDQTLKSDALLSPQALLTESAAPENAPLPPGPSTAPGRPESREGAHRGLPWEAILAHDDANHDGKISREEFRGPPQLFDRLDRNHDGFITREEHEALFPPPSANRSLQP